MRVIEEKMLKALSDNKEFQNTNTRVIINKRGKFVMLYKTIIFAQVKGRKYYSDGGYNTATTSSRLRALGADYSTNETKCNVTLRTQREMDNLFWRGTIKPKYE